MSDDRPSLSLRPPVIDPRAIPVVGVDSHLKALPEDRLTPAWLRQRLALAQTQVHPAAIAGDGARIEGFTRRSPSAAAVLVPLVQRAHGLQVLLTRRTDHLRDHAGQISFPGGRVEPEDVDVEATALREAAEEVGLPASKIEVIGRMPVYTTVTRFLVTPVVALVAPDHLLRLDPNEVAASYEVPLAFLMTPANHRRHRFEAAGATRQFLSMPWAGEAGEVYIWGATAAMLRNLYHLLAD